MHSGSPEQRAPLQKIDIKVQYSVNIGRIVEIMGIRRTPEQQAKIDDIIIREYGRHTLWEIGKMTEPPLSPTAIYERMRRLVRLKRMDSSLEPRKWPESARERKKKTLEKRYADPEKKKAAGDTARRNLEKARQALRKTNKAL